MNHVTAELDQVDEDILNEVSDETLEAAAGTYIGGQFMMTVGPTIMMGMLLNLGSQAVPPRHEGRKRRATPAAADQSFPRFLSRLLRPSKKYCTGTSSVRAS